MVTNQLEQILILRLEGTAALGKTVMPICQCQRQRLAIKTSSFS
jgi:hypothetical protein